MRSTRPGNLMHTQTHTQREEARENRRATVSSQGQFSNTNRNTSRERSIGKQVQDDPKLRKMRNGGGCIIV